ncbi:DUF1667 domain-containing protein [Clostridium sp. MCC353]|uniref:DUF1667 domain-containing protein n=1 Tax=Clostridium sp. MCC353 TaxID=2592646 RepID=UPI001C020E99|nr:DUF1667 domain-containing protein [Clostridium sp. MCC353]MBT9776934.1 DUF1667 domain-containing protein [Clostridium sp. MCC353]
MLKTFTCIMCPRGCEVEAGFSDGRILSVEGNACPKGLDYVTQELTNPMRNIATSVLVEGGEMELASVRLSGPIPKAKIFEVMEQIKGVKVNAPAAIGQVIIADVLGLGVDVIVTKNVKAL